MWTRDVAGLRLTFRLAGINNQNFLMRDEETGTYWQQINGAAISGPLKGSRLTLLLSDELTLAIWKSEQPQGTVLDDVPKYVSEYSERDWDVRMKRAPTVLSFPEHALTARDLMLGLQAFGASRAEPVLLVVGPDDQSVRAFRDRIPGMGGAADFYRITGSSGALLIDDATGSEWNFQGCATAGKAKGLCLEPLPMLKDYWFDWRNYNPKTTVYGKAN